MSYRKKSIAIPAIKTDGTHFADYSKIWDEKAKQYNQGKKLGEQLRRPHAQLFFDLIHLYRRQHLKLFKQLKGSKALKIDPNTPTPLFTNRIELAHRLKCNPSTIYRQIMRLIDAGIIKGKINHGTRANFELIFDADMVLIFDLADPGYLPNSKFLHNNDGTIKSQLRANCSPYVMQNETSNNIIINTPDVDSKEFGQSPHVENEQKVNDNVSLNMNRGEAKSPENDLQKYFDFFPTELFSPESEQKTNSARPNNATNNATGKNSRAQGIMDRIKNKTGVSWEVKTLSKWFVAYLIKVLFANKTIFDGERSKTQAYVEKYYFEGCHTQKALENRAKKLKWCVDAAKRHIDRTNYDFSNIYPHRYVQHDNTKSGFVNTFKWYTANQKYHQRKKAETEEYKDFAKLQAQLRKYARNQTQIQFKACEQYVRKNIPHLMQEFRSHFNGK